MELVYLWVEKYKNIQSQGFNFSPRFDCKFYDEYDKDGKLKDDCKLDIKPKEHIENFFGDNINVTAIVGKNGSGKSNLLKLLFNDEKSLSYVKDSFYIFMDGTSKQLKLYYFDRLRLRHVKNIETNRTYTLSEIKENTISEHEFSMISFSPMYQELPTHTGDENTNFKNISTAYLVHNFSDSYIKFKSKTIENILLMLQDTNIDLPFKIPRKLNIVLNNSINEQLTDKISDEINNFATKAKYNIIYNYYDSLDDLSKENFIEDTKALDTYITEILGYSNIPLNNFLSTLDIQENEYSYTFLTLETILSDGNDFIDKLKELNEIDILDAIKVFNFNWKPELSSGQEAFLFQFANLYNAIKEITEEKISILIDEGETTMHPDWQKTYLKWYVDFLSKNFTDKKFHIIFTTHSPFLISDIPKQNIIFLDTYKKDEGEQKIGNCKVVDGLSQTFGANIHTLLSDSFFMEDGLMGEFAKGKINEIKEFYQKVEKEKEKNTDENLEYYNQNKDKFWQIQKIIGEPFLQRVIKNYLDELELFFTDDETLIDKELAEIEKRKVYLESLKNDKT